LIAGKDLLGQLPMIDAGNFQCFDSGYVSRARSAVSIGSAGMMLHWQGIEEHHMMSTT
jgi:hypothetical protein